jgi:hypothetical protein
MFIKRIQYAYKGFIVRMAESIGTNDIIIEFAIIEDGEGGEYLMEMDSCDYWSEAVNKAREYINGVVARRASR